MKNLILRIALMLTAMVQAPVANAQPPEPVCGWTADLYEQELLFSGDPNNPCFNVDGVLNDCAPVYIRFNFHFFTDTDCSGHLQVSQTEQIMAYDIAEKLVNDANQVLANNQIQWQFPGAVAVCNPLRYMLAGVYIHCQNNATGGSATSGLHSNWGVHKDTEINVYIANFPGSATGIGFPTYANIDWLETGNFNHEIGHVFALIHTFDPTENCSDTPRVTYDWDKNCNGNPGDPGEQLLQCWSFIDPDKLPGQPGFTDSNNNGVHDCNEIPPCVNSPCCNWAYIDNNFMSYNAYKSSYTKCQLGKMLTDLAVNDCNYIEKIGGCPPPHAFISQTPEDKLNTEYCRECLVLQASFNEDRYLFEIFGTPGTPPVYSSGWVDGKAENFCFFTNRRYGGHYLAPNTQYTAVLTVKNDCHEKDSTSYVFTTPSAKCRAQDTGIDTLMGTGERVALSPNPVSDLLHIRLAAGPEENITLFITNTLGGAMELKQLFTPAEGETTLDIPVGHLETGVYTVSITGEHLFYQSHFIKI